MIKAALPSVRRSLALLSCVLTLSSIALAGTESSEFWIGTWAASPEAKLNTSSTFGRVDTTYREIVHVSVGGPSVRIVVTNEFGLEPLTLGAAAIAISKGGGTFDPSTMTTVHFGGEGSVTLPAGTIMVSDPVQLRVPPLSDLAVSLFIPAQKISQISVHTYALQTNYQAQGDLVGTRNLDAPTETASWPFLRAVEVQATSTASSAGSIVALGDSITDGAASKSNMNGRWPDELARRLQADESLSGMGVLNAGINGNRLLHDGDGQSALGRLDRDVLTEAGVKYIIILEGINDIGHIVSASPGDPPVTAQNLIQALDQIVTRAHTHGIKVIGATITPYENCKYASVQGEKMRQAVNNWIRTTKDLDGIADFDKITRDPAYPARFSPAYDSGDHLHPNAAGLKAMADGMDLGLFAH
jgi:lysophospholipase L1-like esterase